MNRLPIVERLMAGGADPAARDGDVTIILRNPDGLEAVAVIEQLVAHIALQATNAAICIAEGKKAGAVIWREALERGRDESLALLSLLAADRPIAAGVPA